MGLDSGVLIRIAVAGVDGVKRGFRDTATEGRNMGQSVTSAADGSGNALAEAAKQAKAFGFSLEHAAQQSSGIKQVSKDAANASNQIQDADTATRNFGQSLAIAAKEGVKSFADLDGAAGSFSDKLRQAEERFAAFKTKVGFGLTAGAAGGGVVLGGDVMLSARKQTQLKSIEALTKSPQRAGEIYNEIDEYAPQSAFELPELVDAGKNLTANRIYSKRNLQAADDAAAVDPKRFKPEDVSRMFGRIRNGDTGEAFERLADFGIGKDDLKAKGLKFDGGGQLEDKSRAGLDRALDVVISLIEERFHGLSQKIATETLEGALSNLNDSIGRFRTSIGDELIGTINLATGALNSVVGMFSNLPRPMRFIIAWGSVLGVALMGIVGVLLLTAGTVGKFMLMMQLLKAASAISGMSQLALAKAMMMSSLAVGKFVAAKMFGYIPAILSTIGPLLAVAAIAYGVAATIDGIAKAQKQSDEELKKHWSGLGSFWVAASDALTNLLSHPLFKLLFPNTALVAQAAGLTTENNDPAHDRKLYEAEIAGRKKFKKPGADESFESWDAKRKAKHKTMSDGDKETTEAKSGAAVIAPAIPPTPTTPTMTMGGATPLATGSLPNGSQTLNLSAYSGGSGGSGGSGASVEDLEDRLMSLKEGSLNGEDNKDEIKRLNFQLSKARLAERRQNKSERQNKKDAKEAEQEALDKRIEDGIDALGDGSADVGRIQQLRGELSIARRKKDKAQVTIISERIARAMEAERAQNKSEAAQKKLDNEHKRLQKQLDREALEDKIAEINEMQRSGRISKEEARKRIRDLRRASQRNALGSLGGALGLSAGMAADKPSVGNGLPPISENEKPWIGYARQSVGQMSQADALKFITKQSAYFEKGGFNGEAEMSAWQRAYTEKYGPAAFGSTAFQGNPHGNNVFAGYAAWGAATPDGTVDSTTSLGSRNSNNISQSYSNRGAAMLSDFGAGFPADGAAGKPQNGGDESLTVRGRQEVIQQGVKKIIRTIVPDLVLEDSFAHAVNGVRRR